MGISNITIDSITDIQTLELDPGGGGGPTPPEEEMYPMPTSSIEMCADESKSGFDIPDTSRLGLVTGDVLIAAVTVEGNVTVGITPDQAGWTEMFKDYDNVITAGLWWRIVNTATDPTQYTWSGFGTKDFCCRFLPIRGADQTTPFPDSFTKVVSAVGVTTFTAPDITTSVDGMTILRLVNTVTRLSVHNTFLYNGFLLGGYNGSIAKFVVLPMISSQSTGVGAALQKGGLQFQPSAGAAGVWSLPDQPSAEYSGYTIPIAPAP